MRSRLAGYLEYNHSAQILFDAVKPRPYTCNYVYVQLKESVLFV